MDFLKSLLFKNLIGAAVVLALLFVAYSKGEEHIQLQWDLSNAETGKQIALLTEKSNSVSALVEIKYVDRIKVVKEKGEKIVQLVPQYITPTDNDSCVISGGFVSLYDAAIENKLPSDTEEIDNRTTAVSLSQVASNAAINFSICHQYKEQADGLKEWIIEQRAINP